MKNPEVKNIIKIFLEENGFDGLFCDECGCDKKHDFHIGEK